MDAKLDKAIILDVDINDCKGRAFVDSGCTFNAVSTEYARICNLSIVEKEKDIVCAIGGGKIISIKRRIAECDFGNENLGRIHSKVFVMDDIPLGCDMILGMEFLRMVNPVIDWNTGRATVPVVRRSDVQQNISSKEIEVIENNILLNTYGEEELKKEKEFQEHMMIIREVGFKNGDYSTMVITTEEYETYKETAPNGEK